MRGTIITLRGLRMGRCVSTGGTTPVGGNVSAVNGQATGYRVIRLTPNSDGTLAVNVN